VTDPDIPAEPTAAESAIDLDVAVPAATPPARRRMPVLIAAGATLLLLIGVGIGYQVLSGDDRRPEQFMPASVAAFASVDLDPGLGQQLSLLRLAKKLPASAGVGTASNPKNLVEQMLTQLHLDGVDVHRDLTSWLGLRAGVSEWTDGQKRTYALISVLSTDDAAANAGLRRIADTVHDSNVGFIVRNGTALIAVGEGDADAAARAAAAEAEKTPLASLASFRQAREWLADDPVVLVWADFARVGENVRADFEESGMSTALDPTKNLKGTVILGVRATDEGIEARYRTFGAGREQSLASDALARLAKLPGNTKLAAALSFPKDFGLESMSSFSASGLAFGGLPLLFGGFAFTDFFGGTSSSVTMEPYTEADQAEITKLLEKDPTTLTDAERKRLTELTGGVPAAGAGCGDSWSTDGLDTADLDELDKLMKKDPQDLTKAERKKLKDMLGFDPAECETLGWGGPDLSEAEVKEMETLMAKDPATLTKAERERYKELTGMDPNQFGAGFGGADPFSALSGASIDVAVSSLGGDAGVRINATAASADDAKKLAGFVDSQGTSDGFSLDVHSYPSRALPYERSS
jgi:hypothetical protein